MNVADALIAKTIEDGEQIIRQVLHLLRNCQVICLCYYNGITLLISKCILNRNGIMRFEFFSVSVWVTFNIVLTLNLRRDIFLKKITTHFPLLQISKFTYRSHLLFGLVCFFYLQKKKRKLLTCLMFLAQKAKEQ